MSSFPVTAEHVRQMLQDAPKRGLSSKAQERLTWLLHYCEHGKSVTDTSRHFGIPRMTLYRVLKRFNPEDFQSLEDHSRRPHTIHRKVAVPIVNSGCANECDSECLFCLLRRHDWRHWKSALILASVFVNLVLLTALITAAFLKEGSMSASVSAPHQSVPTHLQDTLLPDTHP